MWKAHGQSFAPQEFSRIVGDHCFFAPFLAFGVNGFGLVSSAFLTPRMKRSSAPGSSSIFDFFAGFLVMEPPDPDPTWGKYSWGSLGQTPKIAALIGEFIAAFGMLEQSLRQVLSIVLEIKIVPAEAVLYALRNTSAKIDIICQVTERSSHPRKEAILDAMGEVSRVASRRNIYLHGVLGIGPGPRAVLWDFRFPVEAEQRRRDVTEADLEQLIFETSDAYNFLALAINPPEAQQPPPWRSKYFQQRGAPGTGSKRRRQKLKRTPKPPR